MLNGKMDCKKPIKMRSLRWIAEILQAVLILGLPFVKIGGQSALRFDIPTLRLHVFGYSIWMQEFFIVLIATIFITLLILFVTLVFGRIWCGWLCPQTVLIDFTPFMDKARQRGFAYKLMAYVLTFIVSVIVAASLIWYFVSPYEFIPNLINGSLGSTTWGFWIVMTVIIFLNYAFLRHKWCATVCPYAKLQTVMFDKSTLVIELDPARKQECINCHKCEKVCPTEIDIKKGLNAACINCAECLDACNEVMSKFNKKGLIHYAFGSGGEGRVLRQNFFVVGAFTLIFFVFLVYLAFVRSGVDFTVLPHNMEARMTKDGTIINAYVLVVENMLNEPVDLRVDVEKFDDSVVQSVSGAVHMEAGQKDKLPLFVKTRNPLKLKGIKKIKIVLKDDRSKINVTKEANFIFPDEL
jgi:cytochrome c oxidase accessory protein FixG